jgi:hypothetical protein
LTAVPAQLPNQVERVSERRICQEGDDVEREDGRDRVSDFFIGCGDQRTDCENRGSAANCGSRTDQRPDRPGETRRPGEREPQQQCDADADENEPEGGGAEFDDRRRRQSGAEQHDRDAQHRAEDEADAGPDCGRQRDEICGGDPAHQGEQHVGDGARDAREQSRRNGQRQR